MENKATRIVFLDILRVLACFMVIMVHSGEFFYIGNGGTLIRDNSLWVGIYGSLLRSSVPLFVMISGFLLLPIKLTPSDFYKRRFTRILIPLLFWSVLYAIIPCLLGEYGTTDMVRNLVRIPINFSDKCGHLWYVYMLIGLYLFIPILSPWIQSTSKRFEQGFLLVWGITLLIPYLKMIFPEMFGEAYWNPYSSVYYFSGFIGYLVLGHYLKEHVHLPQGKSILIGSLLIILGYAITYYGFALNMESAPDVASVELTWKFTTINVAMMATGLFLIIKSIRINPDMKAGLLTNVSNLSFGMYLAHIFILNQLFKVWSSLFSSPMVIIPILAISTFITTYL
ncbi:MAG: acyltransferase family protein, partial [Bacteroidota bacterium]|nr:acyltransferase family protein [Bacteroidota bacterium]